MEEGVQTCQNCVTYYSNAAIFDSIHNFHGMSINPCPGLWINQHSFASAQHFFHPHNFICCNSTPFVRSLACFVASHELMQNATSITCKLENSSRSICVASFSLITLNYFNSPTDACSALTQSSCPLRLARSSAVKSLESRSVNEAWALRSVSTFEW